MFDNRAAVGSLGEQSSEGPRFNPGGITGSPAPMPKKGVKRKLDTKTYETKYDAIMEVERGSLSKKQITEKFDISSSTLSTWLKNAQSIRQKVTSGEVGPQRNQDPTAKFPKVEDALLKWFTNARTQSVAISGEMMQEKAHYFADKIGVTKSDFDCSAGWLEHLKSRHAIVFKRVCGQSNDVNSNSLNSNFRITRVFPPVPNFFLHKVTKFTSDNSRSDNSKFRLTGAGFPVPRP